MNLSLLIPSLSLALLGAFLQGYLGKRGQKAAGKDYDFRSYFPYELYGDSRSPFLLFARIFEGISLLSLLVLPIALTMNGAIIRKGALVEDSIIGPDTLIDTDEKVNLEHDGIALVVNGKAAQ